MLTEDLKGAGYKDNCGITNAEIKQKKSALYLGTTQNRFSASQLPKILPYCKVSTGLHINEKKYIVQNEKKKYEKKYLKNL